MSRLTKVGHLFIAGLVLLGLLVQIRPLPVEAAVAGTNVGTLFLYPAFENIGVVSPFSGDDNGNNGAVLEYREVGASAWTPGMDMSVDRRDYLYEFVLTGEPDNNPVPNSWKNQWRAVILGLKPNTDYEVRVRYTDPDGVSGTNPVAATIRTRNDNPSSTGRAFYVSTTGNDSNSGLSQSAAFRTIQHAVSIVNPGDTVLVMPGRYTEDGTGTRPGISISRSGTVGNYITVRSYDLNNKAIIDGQNRLWYGFHVTGSYIRIKGFEMRDFNGDPGGNVGIDTGAVGNIIEDNILINPGGHWADSGVLLGGSSSLIQRNRITTTNATDRADAFGIFFFQTLGGNVVRENTIITEGYLKDGISGIGNMRVWGGPGPNSFIYNNYIQGPWDDGIEAEGGNLNVAVWSNTIKNNSRTDSGAGMNMGLGFASTIVGPLYAFRNVVIDNGDAGIKLGSDSFGHIYLYHNTIYTNNGAGPSHFGNNAVADNLHLRNNLVFTGNGRSFEIWGDPSQDHGLNSWDYNAYHSTRGGTAPSLQGVWYTDRVGLDTFRSRHGQEIHGMIVDDPRFVNAVGDNLRLQSTSPVVDKGVVLRGFNDQNSPWPYQGTSPDIGAFELASGPPQPVPTSYTFTLTTMGSGSVSPAAGTYTYAQGQVVNISATPASGWQFSGWTGAVANPGSAATTVTVDSNKTVTANFSQVPAPPPPSPTPPAPSPSPGGTFGLNSGSGTWTQAMNMINAMKFTSLQDSTLSGIGLLVSDTTPLGNVRVAMYDHDSGTDRPRSPLWGSASTPVSNGRMEWATSAVSLKANTTYWLAFWLDQDNGISYQSGSGRHVWLSLAYQNWPAALNTGALAGSNNNQYVMWASYGATPAPSNAPPTARDDSYITNSPAVQAAPGVLGNDVDPNGDPLTAVLMSRPAHGTLTFNANGSFVYNPAAGYSGADSFTYVANDGQANSNVATATISVAAPVNEPPVLAAIGNKSVTAGQNLSFTVSATDPNSDPLTYSASNLPVGASFNAATRTFSWTPTAAQVGTYSNVAFQISDGNLTDSETVSISVNAAASSGQSTTAGTLSLVPTFVSIGVYANFTGDSDGDNQTTLEYRRTGSTQWITAHPMTADRRATFISNGASVNNPYKNQWRGSIVGLTPNTQYDVRVTFVDPDGVSGSPVTATMRTRNDAIFLGTGTAYYVATTGNDSNPGTQAAPFRSIQRAANAVRTGDTVYVGAGTYSEKVTITASGAADNYITFLPLGNGDVIIDGQSTQEYGIAVGVAGIVGTGQGTQQGGHYVRISGFKVINSRYAGINVGGNNVVIENSEIRDFNRADDQDADHRTSGITVNDWGATGMVIRNNLIVRNIGTAGFNAPMGIHIRNENANAGGGHIIANNRIISVNRQIKDGIGGLPNFAYTGSLYRDSDVYDNYIEGVYDDAIESEGGNMNVRIWGNTLKNSQTMALGAGSTIIGPLYVFRNAMYGFNDAAFKLGNSSTGTIYIYHNTVYAGSAGSGVTNYAGSGLENVVSRNNIYRLTRYVMDIGAGTNSGNSYNYDNLYTTDTSRFVRWYATTYSSLTSFRTATGQELNGISAVSQFVDAANGNFHLQSTSADVDKGVSLPGFNDANSPWPHRGSAPDLGAYEYDSGAVANQAPVLATIGNKSVTAGQLLQFATSATDPNGDPLTFAASNLPSGASFNAGTRTFTWTPTAAQVGNYPSVGFQVTDGTLTDSETIAVSVTAANAAPVLAAIGNKSASEGSLLTFSVSATDPNSDPLTYSASNLPSGSNLNAATRMFSWTPTFAQAGTYSNVQFQVADGSLTDSESITITVTNVNRPPVLASIGSKSATEGQRLEFTISGTDPDGDPLTFSAVGLPQGSTFDPATRTFSWTPAYGQAGTYAGIGFQVSDGQANDSEVITIRVGASGRGDVNQDGSVDVSDALYALLLYSQGFTDWGPQGDVNGDGQLNLADVQDLLGIIMVAS